MLFGMGIGAGMLIYRSSDRLVTVVSRELPDGTVYSGQMSHRRLEGRGLLVYPDGETYDGFFRHSRKHGFGVQRYADGSVYEGLWVHGERSGEGTLTTARGMRTASLPAACARRTSSTRANSTNSPRTASA